MRFRSKTTQDLYSIWTILVHEYKVNLFSWRMAVILILFAFGVIGAAYGMSYIVVKGLQDYTPVNYSEPEEIIFGVAAFIAYLGSVMTLVFAFDSITKEKVNGSLDFLMTRPVSKRGIIAGKFLGIWLALLTPVYIVIAVCIGIITYMVGAPDVSAVVALFLLTALFIGTYVSFQQIFSTMAKSLTEALVTAMFVFLLYTMFWQLFPLGLAYILNKSFGYDIELTNFADPTMSKLFDFFSLFNPNAAYQSGISGVINPEYVSGMHHLVPMGALILWFVVTLVVNIEVFNRKG